MKKTVIFLAFLMLELTSPQCSFAQKSLLGSWYYPGGAIPCVRMDFNPDGSLIFNGGFTDRNPSSWTYDPSISELRIVLGPTSRPISEEEISVFKYQISQDFNNPNELVKIFPEERLLIYKFSSAKHPINIGNFIYFREELLASKKIGNSCNLPNSIFK